VVVVAKPEALALADYLISLKRQYPVPDSSKATDRMAIAERRDGGSHGGH
jgi:hypothetical protein